VGGSSESALLGVMVIPLFMVLCWPQTTRTGISCLSNIAQFVLNAVLHVQEEPEIPLLLRFSTCHQKPRFEIHRTAPEFSETVPEKLPVA
jgi:hypothetical protein